MRVSLARLARQAHGSSHTFALERYLRCRRGRALRRNINGNRLYRREQALHFISAPADAIYATVSLRTQFYLGFYICGITGALLY
jgi:hypothetical protein